jgi:hypothetical protein
MRVTQQNSTPKDVFWAGRWITERQYAELTSISKQTLANWRFRDKKAGRSGAAPGFPVYRRFGRSVRYWVDAGAA